MTVAYFDASGLVKLILDETGSPEAAALWDNAHVLASSRLSYPEVRAALAAASRNRDLSPDQLNRAERRLEEHWSAVHPVELTSQVELLAGTLASSQALRGADSVHLASALTLPHNSLIFACWDKRLHSAARRLDLIVAPRSIPDERTRG